MSILTLVESVLAVLNCALDKELQDCDATSLKFPPTDTAAGIYAIYHLKELVYLGSAANLRTRLREHAKSIESASELKIYEFFYRVVPCGKVAALAVEKHLIAEYQPRWNRTGFGSKTNGNGRRHGQPSSWDADYGRAVIR
jgi:Eco29kI restriction endonuclease